MPSASLSLTAPTFEDEAKDGPITGGEARSELHSVHAIGVLDLPFPGERRQI
jgi:hypothetical protein